VTAVPKAESSASAKKRILGEEGVWIFILGDMTVFAVFFIVYAVQRSQQSELFDSSQASLNKNFGAINTIFLLVSSLFVVIALHARKLGQRQLAQRLIPAAFLCGLAFIVVKVFEYHERLVANETPNTNNFYMFYYVLTGLHLFHLVIDMGVLVALWLMARQAELSKNRWAFFEGGACFWHMVDLLWLVLFPLIFLVR
jgi:nitric oxide reductase NorE protein